MEHANEKWWTAGLVVVWSALILYTVITAQRGKDYFVRRIAGLNAVDEAVGRATEMGRPVLMVPGLGDFNIIMLQALMIFQAITRTCSKFGNKIIIPCSQAPAYTVAQELVHDTYVAEGREDLYDADSVRFLTDKQFAFASGVSGIMYREEVATAFYFGQFYAESLIFAESGQMIGAIQVAGTTQTTQIPFFIAACDYVIIGDEYYAASAYISREPTLLGSLVGQDYCKAIIWVLVVLGTILSTIPGGKDLMLFRWLFQL
jgi:hypothetical protein